MPNVELKRGQEVKEDAFEIRRRVFMEEQGYTDEFDDIDDTCIHIVLYKDGEPAGCARTFPEPAGSTRWAVGRVAVESWYGLMGYTRFGEVDYEDEGQPHIWMEKIISRP